MTPAATRRSQTSCAAGAGVAMTPMATCCWATISSSSSRERTGREPTTSPTRLGSLSSSATMRKPREEKPA